ncbi:hypothetical protein MKEN_00444500 [Mycena kentingensis (nom. inval.)]|nr:hypothetical protein MKEN_00444500 [Mycena kentingensis (nom. inval.)]
MSAPQVDTNDTEAAFPPPTYSYNGADSTEGDTQSLSSVPLPPVVDLEACGGRSVNSELPYAPSTPCLHMPMAIPLPLPTPRPQRRPTTASGVPSSISSSDRETVRISMYPEHKIEPIQPVTRRLSLLSASSRSAAAAASGGAPNDGKPHAKLNPTNYVSVFRKTHRRTFSLGRFSASIKGAFAVNPFLEIPAQLLSPLPPGESTRKNLQLKVESGGIDVDVYLVGEPPASVPPGLNGNVNTSSIYTTATTIPKPITRTEVHLELCGGVDNTFPLLARIHTPTIRRPPVRLTLISKNGFLSLHLPPSFHGLLRITVSAGDLNSHITLSATLAPHATILSEDSTSRAYFIGGLGAGRWEGDRAEVNVDDGKVRIQFSGSGERDLDGLRRVGWDWMRV